MGDDSRIRLYNSISMCISMCFSRTCEYSVNDNWQYFDRNCIYLNTRELCRNNNELLNKLPSIAPCAFSAYSKCNNVSPNNLTEVIKNNCRVSGSPVTRLKRDVDSAWLLFLSPKFFLLLNFKVSVILLY